MPIEITQTASPEEAAAVAAAIQRFSQETALAAPARPAGIDPWMKDALEAGVSAKQVFGPGEPLGTF